ncbi:MAG: bacteriophage holin [Planctomycetota bacterium]|jgi:hypothetical protein
MKLDTTVFAQTSAIIWGVAMFFGTWWMIMFTGSSPEESTIIGRLYLGYTISPAGSVIGLVWGLVDGAIAGWLFAWLYNTLLDRQKARIKALKKSD